MKRITLKDLAKHLNLSTSTVSRALLNNKDIHPDTQKKVVQAANAMGYKPNATAVQLKYGKTKSIGFVVPEMETPFSATVLQGVQQILYPLGYKVIILQSDENPLRERENLLLLESFNVDGIIINLCHKNHNQALYKDLIERGTPLVFFDRLPENELDISKVVVNDFVKASLMVEHLISCGCTKIVHLTGPSSLKNTDERSRGYKQILNKHKIYNPALLIKTEETSFEYGKMVAKQLLDNKVDFDSIFAFTDTLAIGAMNYLLEQGMKIPEEVAIASFSGTTLSTNVFPQLSSVAQPLVKMGEVAAELVLEKIKNNFATSKTIVLEAALIYRQSTLGKSKNDAKIL